MTYLYMAKLLQLLTIEIGNGAKRAFWPALCAFGYALLNRCSQGNLLVTPGPDLLGADPGRRSIDRGGVRGDRTPPHASLGGVQTTWGRPLGSIMCWWTPPWPKWTPPWPEEIFNLDFLGGVWRRSIDLDVVSGTKFADATC